MWRFFSASLHVNDSKFHIQFFFSLFRQNRRSNFRSDFIFFFWLFFFFLYFFLLFFEMIPNHWSEMKPVENNWKFLTSAIIFDSDFCRREFPLFISHKHSTHFFFHSFSLLYISSFFSSCIASLHHNFLHWFLMKMMRDL